MPTNRQNIRGTGRPVGRQARRGNLQPTRAAPPPPTRNPPPPPSDTPSSPQPDFPLPPLRITPMGLAREIQEDVDRIWSSLCQRASFITSLMQASDSELATVSRHFQAYIFEFHIYLRACSDLKVAEERERNFYQWWSTLSPTEQQERLYLAQDMAPRRWPAKAWL
ncbi:hypothetical protein COCC4DRAFT_44105 [Bipolaris maydis ATCC 48331]|uniref:Uncharacterized protein n=2 Tax=Cochliobolus heterostrophus TaxID=5016 RepID=M2U3Z2_COCH5|nr:uncharacterized protein COCC4DRAFT_44105 [Bipolaris maydis ATCC 48331]EMD88451.1 hypothetical protein COCHEDRAFT_1110149 [Bipolaris maydis C5]KAJ5063210.1 hypothetical protein J3E74DRAFT_403371 [Bipolaris maydis]ENI00710.1 hypothetical protein COCC4DRAFT_44105 [Bipolaris maydis ATCC 48331]KAJ6199476.1 hypothetical protein J3E72DRAFT_266983 [Bipolaris maydis]KAJ6205927.1 hypothetical protein PSV09DRAFT_1110149 [Bipolaris maydis]